MSSMHFSLIYLIAALTTFSYGQVGIGTITPDNSAMFEVQSTDKGFLLPRMTSAERSSIATPASGLQVYDTNTNSIWYFNGTFWVNTQAMASEGDVKSGIQTVDHSGWVLLDGRPLTALSANQQAVATSLGSIGNIPDASNAYLSQNGNPMASVSGANTTTLTQANLLNVNFTGTAASAGDHSHSGTTNTTGSHVHNMTFQRNQQDHGITGKIGDNGEFGDFTYSGSMQAAGNHSHTVSTNIAGSHTHSVTVSSGGSATPINIAPQTLTVNMFIYLGL